MNSFRWKWGLLQIFAESEWSNRMGMGTLFQSYCILLFLCNADVPNVDGILLYVWNLYNGLLLSLVQNNVNQLKQNHYEFEEYKFSFSIQFAMESTHNSRLFGWSIPNYCVWICVLDIQRNVISIVHVFLLTPFGILWNVPRFYPAIR